MTANWKSSFQQLHHLLGKFVLIFFSMIYLTFIFCYSFWVQLCGPQSTELDFLVDAMTEYYNIKDNQELHQIREPYLGQIVAANFLTDNKWYRAEIVAIQPNDIVKDEIVLDVYFLDYGDQQFVNKSDILELRADFLSLRFQAVECFLAHVQPNQTSSKFEEWDQKSIDAFENMVQVAQWKKLISKVVTYKERKSFALQRKHRESSPVPGVELYEENSDKSIALELVKQGYAELSNRFGDLTKSSVLTVVEDEIPVIEKQEELPPADEIKPEEPEIVKEPPKIEKEEELPTKLEQPTPKIPEEISAPPEKVESEPKAEEPLSTNNNNNNLEPVPSLSNGNSDVFGMGNGSNIKPKKKKKQATADFLSMEQQQNAPQKLDWNEMMQE